MNSKMVHLFTDDELKTGESTARGGDGALVAALVLRTDGR